MAPRSTVALGFTRATTAGGTVAGVLDLLAAFLTGALAGVAPARILESIASGLLGAAAYQAGTPAAVLGTVLHFAIMLVISAAFAATALRAPVLVRHPLRSGAAYGLLVYLVMQYLVLPLSAYPHPVAGSPAVILRGMVIHVLCVGLPIVLITRHCLELPGAASAGR